MVAGTTGWIDRGLEAKHDKSKAWLKHGTLGCGKEIFERI
jgi:hypothetical protein